MIIVVILNCVINGINTIIVDNTILSVIVVGIVVTIEYMIKLPIINLL